MKLLNKVKNIYSEACVSIIMSTHRTKPDNKKDEICLKNLVKEAEKRLNDGHDKQLVLPIKQNLNNVVDSIDHSFNLESLIIYVNNDFAEYTRLPIEVEDRVVIDNTFVTRDLIRAMHSEFTYYVLVLSRDQARLIEAYGDRIVNEIKGDFPMSNSLFTTDKAKSSTNKGQDNLIEEFFNRVDKNVLASVKDNNLPILLATEIRNFSHYSKVADKKEFIIGYISGNRDDDNAQKIVEDSWLIMSDLIKEKSSKRIVELKKAVSGRKVLTDFNEIWNAMQYGKGKTLFIKVGFFQPIIIKDNQIQLMDTKSRTHGNYIDDIIDEMIELNMAYGGDVVFVKGKELNRYNGLALLTRY